MVSKDVAMVTVTMVIRGENEGKSQMIDPFLATFCVEIIS